MSEEKPTCQQLQDIIRRNKYQVVNVSEDNEQMCRPHVNMEEKILSVEAKFWQNPKGKFDRLLDEMR